MREELGDHTGRVSDGGRSPTSSYVSDFLDGETAASGANPCESTAASGAEDELPPESAHITEMSLRALYEDSIEYLNAHTREFRRRDVFANVDESGASETDLLKSMPSREVSNMFLQCPEDWGLRSTMTREGAAAYVCWKVLEDQRLYKACFNRQQDDSIASYSIERMTRRETTNWVMSSQRRDNQRSEIESAFKAHEGEARVWQTSREEWFPLRHEGILACGEKCMGLNFPGTSIGRTKAARGAEFVESKARDISGMRDVFEFGEWNRADDNLSMDTPGPDLNNAVSTLVVRARVGDTPLPDTAPKYWVRKVRIIGLPELYHHYKDELSWHGIYNAYVEGRVVVRRRAVRGARSAASGAEFDAKGKSKKGCKAKGKKGAGKGKSKKGSWKGYKKGGGWIRRK